MEALLTLMPRRPQVEAWQNYLASGPSQWLQVIKEDEFNWDMGALLTLMRRTNGSLAELSGFRTKPMPILKSTCHEPLTLCHLLCHLMSFRIEARSDGEECRLDSSRL